jgi:sterol desaturase/sphingolipid hydroxylase (fatty acid hydroxylase superfamily)
MENNFVNWLLSDSEKMQYILFFILLAVFTIMEFLIPKRKGSMLRKQRWSANYLITFLNVVLLSALPFSFMSASVYASEKNIGMLNMYHLPFFVLMITTLLIRGFISFYTHFLMHKIPIFWRIHRVHHLDTELDVTTTVRFHPFEFVIGLVLGVPVILLFGLPLWGLLLYELLDAVVNLFSHSNIRLPLKLEKFLHYIIVTPGMHRIHHSSYKEETDSNYGAVFPVWDIIFGTFRTITKVPQDIMELGLEEVRDKRTSNVFWLLKSPFLSIKNKQKPRSNKT